MLSQEFLENAKLFFFLFSLDCYDLIELHIKIIFLNFLCCPNENFYIEIQSSMLCV